MKAKLGIARPKSQISELRLISYNCNVAALDILVCCLRVGNAHCSMIFYVHDWAAYKAFFSTETSSLSFHSNGQMCRHSSEDPKRKICAPKMQGLELASHLMCPSDENIDEDWAQAGLLYCR